MADLQHAKDLQHPKHVMPHNQQWGQLITDPGGNIRRNGSRLLLTVKPSGRLGNLMFQWAALLGLARKSELQPVVYSDLPNHQLCPAQGAFGEFALHRFVRQDKFQLCEQIPVKEVRANSFDKNLVYQVKKARCGCSDDAHCLITLAGFFQSFKYFRKEVELVRKAFAPSPSARASADAFLMPIRSRAGSKTMLIGVQVRLGDKVTTYSSVYAQTSWAYYNAAMDLLKTRLMAGKDASSVVFVVSAGGTHADNTQDMHVAYAALGRVGQVVMTRQANPYVDLAILQRCDALVIGPSSLGWWAAFLSSHLEPGLIAAPRHIYNESHRFGQQFVVNDYYPEDWTLLGNADGQPASRAALSLSPVNANRREPSHYGQLWKNLWLGAVISLDSSTPEFARLVRSLSAVGFSCVHVPAASPQHYRSFSHMVFDAFGRPAKGLSMLGLSGKELGLIISHKRAQDCIAKSAFAWGAVFEQDAVLHPYLNPTAAGHLIQTVFELASSQDLIYLGLCNPRCNPRGQPQLHTAELGKDLLHSQAGQLVDRLRAKRFLSVGCTGGCTHAYAMHRTHAATFFSDVYCGRGAPCGDVCNISLCHTDQAMCRHFSGGTSWNSTLYHFSGRRICPATSANSASPWLVGESLTSPLLSKHFGMFFQNRSDSRGSHLADTARASIVHR